MVFLDIITITQITLFFIIFLAATVYLFFKNLYKYWKKRGVYTPKPTIPLGNVPWNVFGWFGGGCTFEEAYKIIKIRSEPYGGYYFLNKPFLVLTDLDVVRKILVTDFEYFTDRLFQSGEYDPMSKHLVSLSGNEWKKMRTKLSPVFTPAKTKFVFSNFIKSAEDLVQAIDRQVAKGDIIELKEIMTNFTIDVIVTTAFGIKSDVLKDRKCDFKENGDKFFDTSLKGIIIRFLMFLYPEALMFFKVPMIRKDITAFFMKMTEDVINMREHFGIVKKDLMHLLLQIRNNVELNSENLVKNLDNQMSLSLSIRDIAAQCFAFFIAGYESSSTTISMCLYELCLHKDIQEKARKEVNTCLKETNGEFTYDVLQDMSYLERCLKETLRKHPPAPIHMRRCTKTYKIQRTGLVIEKGIGVITPALAIHYDSNYFVNPQEFDPDRFLNGTSNAWMPFGIGPRNCIGIHFAWSEVKLVLATMLKTYRFSLHPKTEVPLKFNKRRFFLRSNGGIWVNVDKIE